MSTTAPSHSPVGPALEGAGRPVMAAIDPAGREVDVVAQAISLAQPDGFVVLAAAFPPRPLVSHYWFLSDFGPALWRDDKALPEEDMRSIDWALEMLDQSGIEFTVERLTRPEAMLRRSRQKLVAKALIEVAVRHGVEAIVVGPASKSSRHTASYLRDLTDRPVIEVGGSSSNPATGDELVDAAGSKPS